MNKGSRCPKLLQQISFMASAWSADLVQEILGYSNTLAFIPVLLFVLELIVASPFDNITVFQFFGLFSSPSTFALAFPTPSVIV